MKITIGQPDAPGVVTINIGEAYATATLPQSVDPGPMRELEYQHDNPDLVVNEVCRALLAGPSGGILALLAGDNAQVAYAIGANRTSVSRWTHGHGEMGRCYRLLALYVCGMRRRDGLWVHPDLD